MTEEYIEKCQLLFQLASNLLSFIKKNSMTQKQIMQSFELMNSNIYKMIKWYINANLSV